MSDPVWYRDMGILTARYDEFFPSASQTDAERLNSFVRLVAYASLVAFLVRLNPRYLIIGAVIIGIVSYAYELYGSRTGGEPFANIRPKTVQGGPRKCSRPTPENPFANMTIGTLINEPTRAPACSYDDKNVAADIRRNFNRGLFRNLEDVYEVENSQRQFYTMPVTTSAPDTVAFAEFLYGSRGKTCKELPEKCEPAFATRT